MPGPVKTSKAMLHLSKNILRKWPVWVVLSKGKSRLFYNIDHRAKTVKQYN